MLECNVLVLNKLWQAVNVCSARRAFVLLCSGHAQVVHEEGAHFSTHDYDSWRSLSELEPTGEMVSTVSLRIRVPKVIVLQLFDRVPRKEVKFTRHNLYVRDNSTCQYCGKQFDSKELNLDHVIPRDKGGETSWENIVCSCIRCNIRKGNRLAHEVGMRLLRKPERPRWQPFLHLTFDTHPDESWRHFVDLACWKVQMG